MGVYQYHIYVIISQHSLFCNLSFWYKLMGQSKIKDLFWFDIHVKIKANRLINHFNTVVHLIIKLVSKLVLEQNESFLVKLMKVFDYVPVQFLSEVSGSFHLPSGLQYPKFRISHQTALSADETSYHRYRPGQLHLPAATSSGKSLTPFRGRCWWPPPAAWKTAPSLVFCWFGQTCSPAKWSKLRPQEQSQPDFRGRRSLSAYPSARLTTKPAP